MNSFNITKILAANILVDAMRKLQDNKQDKLDAFFGTEDQEQANEQFDANDVVNSDTLAEEIAERMQEGKNFSFMLVSKTNETATQAKDKIQAAFDRLRNSEPEPAPDAHYAETGDTEGFYDSIMNILDELSEKAQDSSEHAHKTADEIIDDQSEEITSLKNKLAEKDEQINRQREELLKLRRTLETIKGAL